MKIMIYYFCDSYCNVKIIWLIFNVTFQDDKYDKKCTKYLYFFELNMKHAFMRSNVQNSKKKMLIYKTT